jgi:hypothetical protein
VFRLFVKRDGVALRLCFLLAHRDIIANTGLMTLANK